MGRTSTVVDREGRSGSKGAKSQRGGGNRCPPRRRVSFFGRPPLSSSAATISKCHKSALLLMTKNDGEPLDRNLE
jgi:hypothetical protein